MSETDRTKKSTPVKTMAGMKPSAIRGVGYGRPPVERQWQKGQSGNPKGRPPKQVAIETGGVPKELRDMILDSLRQTHRVSDGKGGEKEITRYEALNVRQQKAALDGNPKALQDQLERAERLMADEQRELARINADAEVYQQLVRQEIAEAKAAGKPEPELLVHPDDMIIEDGKPLRYIGPVGPDAQAAANDAAAFRDLAIMQAALESKLFPDDDLKPIRARRDSALLFAVLINDALPHRWQLSEFAFVLAYDKHDRKSKRQLLKEVYAGWRNRGVNVPRGSVLPPVGQTSLILEKVFQLIKEKAVEQRARRDKG